MRTCWIALIVSSCAARAADVQQPSTQPFRAVEAGRCNPEIDGVYLSWADARAVLARREELDLKHELQIITLTQERDDARHQVREIAKAMPDSFMSRWGVLVGIGVGTTATALIAALLFGFAR